MQPYDVAGLALLAPIPSSGTGYGFISAHPLVFFKFIFSRRRKAMISGGKLSKSLFFSDALPGEEFRKYYENLQDESYRAMLDVGREIEWKDMKNKAPVLIMVARKDALISERDWR